MLSVYDKKLYEYANESLTRRRVAIETNSTIQRVDREALYLKDKGRVEYGMLIWATGNKHIPLTEKLASQTRQTTKGLRRILTDDHLRVLEPTTSDKIDHSDNEVYESVFALGDAADILDRSLPTTAEVAVQKAKYLVNYLNHQLPSISTAEVVPPFKYQQKSLVSYLGAHDGVIEGRKSDNGNGRDGEGWTGRSAWLAWRSGSLLWTRSWRNRVMILLTWVVNWIGGKEIARM